MDIPVCVDRRTSTGPWGSSGWLGRPQKYISDMLLHFQLELIILGVSGFSMDENLKD